MKLKKVVNLYYTTLNDENIQTIMMTGDAEATAAAVAKHLEISDYQANCLPEDKAAYVKKLAEKGTFCGDGWRRN